MITTAVAAVKVAAADELYNFYLIIIHYSACVVSTGIVMYKLAL